jgi:hypothetical protein
MTFSPKTEQAKMLVNLVNLVEREEAINEEDTLYG